MSGSQQHDRHQAEQDDVEAGKESSGSYYYDDSTNYEIYRDDDEDERDRVSDDPEQNKKG